MPASKAQRPAPKTKSAPQPKLLPRMDSWKLEDAKARLSEVVRRLSDGPQLVTVRGKEAAVILAPQDYRRLVAEPGAVPLTDFLETLDLGGIDFKRELDRGRELDL
jgi:antitoxin Phd